MLARGWDESSAAQLIDEAILDLGLDRPWRKQRPTLPQYDRVVCADGHALTILGRFHQPRAALLDGLLSPAECEALAAYALSKGLRQSGVVDRESGNSVEHHARTSTSVILHRAETPLVNTIEQRLAQLTGWPVENGEGLQVLQYQPGQQYKPHFDWFDAAKPGSAKHLKRGGQRVATTVMYLATADAGGGTSFPKSGLTLTPRVGGAVFFNDVDVTGKPDAMSLHAGTPVESGTKIVATYWQRESAFV